MFKHLIASAVLLAFATTAAIPATAKSTGWVKTPDVECKYNYENVYTCFLIDNYTDTHLRGHQCAMYSVPVYDGPNGKPIGLLLGEDTVQTGEKSKDGKWTRIWSQHKNDLKLMPYNLKTLRTCG
jgi:hypothetical protein